MVFPGVFETFLYLLLWFDHSYMPFYFAANPVDPVTAIRFDTVTEEESRQKARSKRMVMTLMETEE